MNQRQRQMRQAHDEKVKLDKMAQFMKQNTERMERERVFRPTKIALAVHQAIQGMQNEK